MNRFFAFMAMAASAGGHLFAGSQLSLLKEAFADYANPLEGVVMKVTEEYDGDEGVILKDLKKSNIPAVGISYTFLARDGLMHWQSPTNFSKNIEDGYYDGDSLVMTNTVNPHMLEIYDGKDVYLHLPVPWHAYLSLFWRLQDLLKKPPEGMAVSKAADGGFLIAWNSEDCVNICVKTATNDEASTTLMPNGWKALLETMSVLRDRGLEYGCFNGLDMFQYEALETMWEWTEDNEYNAE